MTAEMFEAGKWYTIHMDENGRGVGYSDWQILSVDGPRIKISNGGISPDRIVNTTSPAFAFAELSPHQR